MRTLLNRCPYTGEALWAGIVQALIAVGAFVYLPFAVLEKDRQSCQEIGGR
jgi:hypothetical protein